MPALVTFEPPPDSMEVVWGINILLVGWLALIMPGNFAWLANVFFIWAFASLRSGRRLALALAWTGILLSMTTFWLLEFLGDEGGGKAWVFGYGWGALAWFAALFLLGIAAAVRNLEHPEDREAAPGANRAARISAGLFGIALVGMFTGVWVASRAQRATVAAAERAYFETAILKRGAVCTTPDFESQGSIRLDGPLEVTPGAGSSDHFAVRDLLAWGVPSVTATGVTYSLRAPLDQSTLVISPQTKPSVATLSARTNARSETARFFSMEFQQVVETRTLRLAGLDGRVLLDGTWRRLYGQRFCPTYAYGRDRPPGALLLSTLQDAEGRRLDLPHGARANNPMVVLRPSNIRVVRMPQPDPAGEGADCSPVAARIKVTHLNNPALLAAAPLLSKIKSSQGYGYGFVPDEVLRIGDIYLGVRREPRLTTSVACDGDAVYIFSALSGQDGRDLIHAEMRSLTDIHERLWSGQATLTRPAELESGLMEIHALKANRQGEGLALVLAYRETISVEVSHVQVDLLP